MSELLRDYWDWFLFDTLLWTGALVALVMLLRRPVAKHFGAGAAYALWFLPLARLLTPPFTLPGWMRPVSETVAAGDQAFAMQAGNMAMPVAEPGMAAPTVLAQSAAPVDFLTPLLLLWLGGALVMLVRRFWLYFALRRELLADARPVGEVGSIRLIETPAISGPMAFGVIDRVIALPSGFMASREREARDLAIAHELAHHRGGDLIANMLVQPLFAIHWFNPLGHLGWTALRRDQEAWCDARVVAARSQEERATYASVIADFARLPAIAPRPALAAPMACPVLGDKSIIHRLRSLSMSDISPRRRLLGRSALVAAFLAVPLTASIAYADAISAAVEPEAPLAPEPPVPPVPPQAPEVEFDIDDEDVADGEGEHKYVRVERKVDDNGKVTETRRVYRLAPEDMTPEQRAEFEADMAEMRREFGPGGEFEREMRELRRELGPGGEMHREIRVAVAEARAAGANAPEVVISCRNPRQPVTSEVTPGGKTRLYVCETAGNAIARDAIVSARKAISADKHMPAEARAEALATLDRQIAEIDAE